MSVSEYVAALVKGVRPRDGDAACSAWQDIATAPKDGTRVLLTFPKHALAKRTWGTIRIGKWDGCQWKLDMAGHFRNDCTHWQPLPPPPAPAPPIQVPSRDGDAA